MSKTIQLRDETYSDLKVYKVGGLTFDEVIRRLMEKQAAEDFHEEYRKRQRKVLANMKKSGHFKPL